MPKNDFRMRALPSQALWKTILRGCCEAADKGSFLTLVFVHGREVEARHLQSHLCHSCMVACLCPWAWSLFTLSISFPAVEAVMIQSGSQVFTSPHFPRNPITLWPSVAQSLLPEPLTHGPGSPVAPRRLHPKAWLRGSKLHTDAADLCLGHLLLWWDVPGLPLPQARESPTLVPLLSRIQGPSSPSPALLHTWIHFSLSLFFFLLVFIFFFSLSHYPFNAEQGCWLQKRQFDSSNRSSSLILTVMEIPAATRIRGSIHICQF